MEPIVFEMPLEIRSQVHGKSSHWWAVSAKRKSQRQASYLATSAALRRAAVDPLTFNMDRPLLVTLTRVIGYRGRALDDDNLRAAFKSVRDGVSDAFGLKDGPKSPLKFVCTEDRGAVWAVRIRIEERKPE